MPDSGNDAGNLMKRIEDFTEILPGTGEAAVLEADPNRQFRELRSRLQQAKKSGVRKMKQYCRKVVSGYPVGIFTERTNVFQIFWILWNLCRLNRKI